jgi:hypothetical protein
MDIKKITVRRLIKYFFRWWDGRGIKIEPALKAPQRSFIFKGGI